MKPTRGQLIVAILCLMPLAFLLVEWQNGSLSANPIEALTQRTGRTAVILLLASLACTPLRILFGLSAMLPIRKGSSRTALLWTTLSRTTLLGPFCWSSRFKRAVRESSLL